MECWITGAGSPKQPSNLWGARGHWECWTTGVGVCKQAFVVVMSRRTRFIQGIFAGPGRASQAGGKERCWWALGIRG